MNEKYKVYKLSYFNKLWKTHLAYSGCNPQCVSFNGLLTQKKKGREKRLDGFLVGGLLALSFKLGPLPG